MFNEATLGMKVRKMPAIHTSILRQSDKVGVSETVSYNQDKMRIESVFMIDSKRNLPTKL